MKLHKPEFDTSDFLHNEIAYDQNSNASDVYFQEYFQELNVVLFLQVPRAVHEGQG